MKNIMPWIRYFCLTFYILEDSSDLGNLPLWNIEWTLILQFRFLGDLIKLFFFTRFLCSPKLMKRTKINSSTIFEECHLNLKEKKLKIDKHSWLSIIWIFKLLLKAFQKSSYLTNYLQSKTTFWAKLRKNHMQ